MEWRWIDEQSNTSTNESLSLIKVYNMILGSGEPGVAGQIWPPQPSISLHLRHAVYLAAQHL